MRERAVVEAIAPPVNFSRPRRALVNSACNIHLAGFHSSLRIVPFVPPSLPARSLNRGLADGLGDVLAPRKSNPTQPKPPSRSDGRRRRARGMNWCDRRRRLRDRTRSSPGDLRRKNQANVPGHDQVTKDFDEAKRTVLGHDVDRKPAITNFPHSILFSKRTVQQLHCSAALHFRSRNTHRESTIDTQRHHRHLHVTKYGPSTLIPFLLLQEEEEATTAATTTTTAAAIPTRR